MTRCTFEDSFNIHICAIIAYPYKNPQKYIIYIIYHIQCKYLMWSQGKCKIKLNKVCEEKLGNKNDDIHD